MSHHSTPLVLTCAFLGPLSWPSLVVGAPASTDAATAEVSTKSAPSTSPDETSVSASTSTPEPETPATTSNADAPAPTPSEPPSAEGHERLSPRDPRTGKDRWIHRYPPQAMTGEVGVFGGVWFPSRRLELYGPDPSLPDSGFQNLNVVTPDIGVRGGFYPLRFVGIEAEAAVMPTRTQDTDARATAWAVRGHVIGQLGLWSVTPFLLVGAGVMGIAGDDPPESLGSDQDVSIHFGGGVKAQINDWIQLRLDVRDVVSNRRGVGEGLTSSPEILLGVSVALGRRKHKDGPSPARRDRDGDGITDTEDFCPDVFGEPPRGCPQVCVDDQDGDGLSDPVDACPTDPESRNGFEDDDGCPDEVPEEIESLAGVMEGIEFETDKDTIREPSRPTLDHAVEVMTKYPDLKVEIGGHTDSRGGYRHNMDLSRRRAEAVKAYMVEAGIDPSRLETHGYGPDQPIATNDTADGRAQNRRIEFKVKDGGSTADTPTE